MDRLKVKRLFVEALEHGGRQIGPFEVEWEVHGDCLMPVRREVYARKGSGVTRQDWAFKLERFDRVEDTFDTGIHSETARVTYGTDKLGPYVVYLTVRCRMCDKCRAARHWTWRQRALDEFNKAPRTWMFTTTLSPEWRVVLGARAALRSTKRGLGVFEALPFDEQFRLKCHELGIELTKFLKRLRKRKMAEDGKTVLRPGYQFRYLLVFEAHQDGEPHAHLALNEIAPMRKRFIQAEWALGFSECHLVDAEGATYATKYLAKNMAARVRASLHYGSPLPASA